MKLKELLIEKHITQKELSLRTGITEATISRYVNKERECGLNNAYKIAIALGIEIKDLLEYKPQSYADKMLEELGYKKNFESEYNINYKHLKNTIINFNKNNKTLNIYINNITIKELQAINEKVKELRLV